jgi:hypothetical protein
MSTREDSQEYSMMNDLPDLFPLVDSHNVYQPFDPRKVSSASEHPAKPALFACWRQQGLIQRNSSIRSHYPIYSAGNAVAVFY